MGYTKLFSSIVASTIWREDDKTRIVWITMLAMKDERHVVEASLPGLADLARVSIEECQKAINKLGSPDKYSRNQQFQGRRIEPCAGGWRILNGEFYRKRMSDDDRREYQRVYHREYRRKKAAQTLAERMESSPQTNDADRERLSQIRQGQPPAQPNSNGQSPAEKAHGKSFVFVPGEGLRAQ